MQRSAEYLHLLDDFEESPMEIVIASHGAISAFQILHDTPRQPSSMPVTCAKLLLTFGRACGDVCHMIGPIFPQSDPAAPDQICWASQTSCKANIFSLRPWWECDCLYVALDKVCQITCSAADVPFPILQNHLNHHRVLHKNSAAEKSLCWAEHHRNQGSLCNSADTGV